jgi:TIGR01906 family protein
MKVISYILAGIFSFCVLIIIAITSVEILVYYVPNYYAHEYNKYDVPRSLSMEVEDLVSVTKEMTAYLKGNRENLSDITATINGQENVNFFNSKEVAHMMDVKALFRAAMTIRLVLLVLSAILLIIMALLKQHPSRIISLMMMICSGVFILGTAVLVFIISSDFDKYFIKFHEIFFNNDLWMLNPETDKLIRLVPIGFFIDTALYVALIFAILLIITIAISYLIFSSTKQVKKRKFL